MHSWPTSRTSTNEGVPHERLLCGTDEADEDDAAAAAGLTIINILLCCGQQQQQVIGQRRLMGSINKCGRKARGLWTDDDDYVAENDGDYKYARAST